MENFNNILKETKTGVILCARIIPNSSFNKIIDFTCDYVRIKICSPAVENKANKELISFCSDFFDLNKSKITIMSGEKSKIKKILLKDTNIDEITQKLMFVLNSLGKE